MKYSIQPNNIDMPPVQVDADVVDLTHDGRLVFRRSGIERAVFAPSAWMSYARVDADEPSPPAEDDAPAPESPVDHRRIAVHARQRLARTSFDFLSDDAMRRIRYFLTGALKVIDAEETGREDAHP